MLLPLTQYIFNHSLSFSIPKRIAEPFHGSFFTSIQRRFVIQENTGQPTTNRRSLNWSRLFRLFFLGCLFLGLWHRLPKKNHIEAGECCLSPIYITSEYFIVASADIFFVISLLLPSRLTEAVSAHNISSWR